MAKTPLKQYVIHGSQDNGSHDFRSIVRQITPLCLLRFGVKPIAQKCVPFMLYSKNMNKYMFYKQLSHKPLTILYTRHYRLYRLIYVRKIIFENEACFG